MSKVEYQTAQFALCEDVGPGGRCLRENPDLCRIPLVAVTTYSYVDDAVGSRTTALDAGFNCFIPKPMEPERFVA